MAEDEKLQHSNLYFPLGPCGWVITRLQILANSISYPLWFSPWASLSLRTPISQTLSLSAALRGPSYVCFQPWRVQLGPVCVIPPRGCSPRAETFSSYVVPVGITAKLRNNIRGRGREVHFKTPCLPFLFPHTTHILSGLLASICSWSPSLRLHLPHSHMQARRPLHHCTIAAFVLTAAQEERKRGAESEEVISWFALAYC